MDVAHILSPSSVRCEPEVASKKHAPELLSDATKLRDHELQKKLRAAKEPDVIYDLLTDNLTISHPAPGSQPSTRRPAGG